MATLDPAPWSGTKQEDWCQQGQRRSNIRAGTLLARTLIVGVGIFFLG